MSAPVVADIECSRCNYHGPKESFPIGRGVKYLAACHACTQKESERRAAKRSARDGGLEDPPEGNPPRKQAPRDADTPAQRRGPDVQPVQGLAHLEWSEIFTLVSENKDQAFELDAYIKMDGESARSEFEDVELGQETAKKIAALLWDATQYRFIRRPRAVARPPALTPFFCSQNENEVTKTRLTEDVQKRRARMKMKRFPCNGYLHVTVDPHNPAAVRLRAQHHRVHCKYVDISLPDETKKLVEEMKDQPATNIWTRVLQDYPGTPQ
ncbi:hypothetical protein DFH06DRAFT_1341777 [Mycena polygramma]|nr:hypothetical protein DFH06DRAFT_1341777 [Mycena polygramma]